jgi:glycerophosphoryl diester phosphodiesterase
MQNFPLFGHRGSGAEGVALADGYHKVNVQENTILSFVTAASLGAQYVEFGTYSTGRL